jgi:hypothetical protein
MEAVRPSKTVCFHETIWCYIRVSHFPNLCAKCSCGIYFTLRFKALTNACYKVSWNNQRTSARNGNLEVPVHFLKAKQGHTVRKTEKDKWISYSICWQVIIINSRYSWPEHRSSTKQRQRTLFWANALTSFHVLPAFPASSATVLFQVILGLPLLRCPSGFQFRAWFSMAVGPFRKVCPIHLHLC